MRHVARKPAAHLAVLLLTSLIGSGLLSSPGSATSGPMKPASDLIQATSASAFARALLNDEAIPADARRVAHATAIEDASGREAVTDLIDLHETFAVKSPFNLATFLRANRPTGATLSGPDTMTGSGLVSVTGYAYLMPFADRHVSYEQLHYSIGPATGGVVDLRVDAQSVWLPVTTVTMPTANPVTITAYDHLSLATGPSGPVSVTLTGVQARRLSHVISLLSTAGGGICAEGAELFVIHTTTPASGGESPVNWTASAQECGDVLIVVVGARHYTLSLVSCALRDLVVSDLPQGEATASRESLEQGCAR